MTIGQDMYIWLFQGHSIYVRCFFWYLTVDYSNLSFTSFINPTARLVKGWRRCITTMAFALM